MDIVSGFDAVPARWATWVSVGRGLKPPTAGLRRSANATIAGGTLALRGAMEAMG